MSAPDLSEDEPACDGSTWQEDRPQVPGLHPGWPMGQGALQCCCSLLAIIGFSSEEQSPPRGISGADPVTAFALRRNETRSLS
jgi:hypothetical protein